MIPKRLKYMMCYGSALDKLQNSNYDKIFAYYNLTALTGSTKKASSGSDNIGTLLSGLTSLATAGITAALTSSGGNSSSSSDTTQQATVASLQTQKTMNEAVIEENNNKITELQSQVITEEAYNAQKNELEQQLKNLDASYGISSNESGEGSKSQASQGSDNHRNAQLVEKYNSKKAELTSANNDKAKYDEYSAKSASLQTEIDGLSAPSTFGIQLKPDSTLKNDEYYNEHFGENQAANMKNKDQATLDSLKAQKTQKEKEKSIIDAEKKSIDNKYNSYGSVSDAPGKIQDELNVLSKMTVAQQSEQKSSEDNKTLSDYFREKGVIEDQLHELEIKYSNSADISGQITNLQTKNNELQRANLEIDMNLTAMESKETQIQTLETDIERFEKDVKSAKKNAKKHKKDSTYKAAYESLKTKLESKKEMLATLKSS